MTQNQANGTGFRGTDEGGKIKSTSMWANGGNGNNSSGFTFLPAGGRNYDGAYGNLTEDGLFWSATQNDNSGAWSRHLNFGEDRIDRSVASKHNGYSVRCLKDSK